MECHQTTTLSFGVALVALLEVFLPGLTPSSVASDGTPSTSLSAPCELKLTPYTGLLRTVIVKSGAYEAPFLFDSGGGGTFLSLAAAKTMELAPFGRLTGFRHDGGRADVPRAGPVALELGTFVRTGEVGLFDLEELLPGLPPLGGIVSLETFAGRALTLDLAHDRLFLESAETLAARTGDAAELAVRAARPAGGAGYDLFVAIEGEHGWL